MATMLKLGILPWKAVGEMKAPMKVIKDIGGDLWISHCGVAKDDEAAAVGDYSELVTQYNFKGVTREQLIQLAVRSIDIKRQNEFRLSFKAKREENQTKAVLERLSKPVNVLEDVINSQRQRLDPALRAISDMTKLLRSIGEEQAKAMKVHEAWVAANRK